jgi:carbonic anhydrase/acetyltransferase-like protein (isoleucine patch superfamily)
VTQIVPFDGAVPKLGQGVFVAPTATIIGKVTVGDQSSIWFGVVLRGDVGTITIGARSNIQDLSMLHMTGGISDCRVGDDVTVGHGVLLHGCDVGDRCLVGMGSIVLDNVRIGEECVIGAGSLLTAGTVVPPRSLVYGRPAKVVRPATEEEIRLGIEGARRYLALVERYQQSGGP